MVELNVILGLKGQVLIPKILREEFGLVPGKEVVLKEAENGLLIQRPTVDPVAVFKELAAKHAKKKFKIDVHAIEKEYEERLRSAGITL